MQDLVAAVLDPALRLQSLSGSQAGRDVQGQLERDVRDPEEQRMRELQGQRGFLALTERFLILHASKIVALMMFWAAMAQPGAIGWLLLGMTACSPAHRLLYHQAASQVTEYCRGAKSAGFALGMIGRSAMP